MQFRTTHLVCLLLFTMCAGVGMSAVAVPACGDIETDLKKLTSVIGAFPPNFSSEKEQKEVNEKYDCVLSLITAKLEKNPNDIELLYSRGVLESLGHNIDRAGAWVASEKDLQAVLSQNPRHEKANLELGMLYVNSYQELAPRAEKLFMIAQEVHGKEILEGAQNGLFFAYYYQGKMKEAEEKIALLRHQWPDNESYIKLESATKQVIKRAGNKG